MSSPPKIQIPEAFYELFEPHRYKLYYGGRGGAKSWAFARALLVEAIKRKVRVLCCREFQNSIRQSVHQLLREQILLLKLDSFFIIKDQTIECVNGSEFLFMGLGRNIMSIKSMENIGIVWVEEAQTISQNSLDILIPTIRTKGSELWFAWNPTDRDAPIEKLKNRLISKNKGIIRKVGWKENPWFTEELEEERRLLAATDPTAYDHVYEGNFQVISDAIIFKNRFIMDEFEADPNDRLFFGVDWGFAKDPTVMVRCFIRNECLYIEYEAYGHEVTIDHLPSFFDQIPQSRRWPIKADNQGLTTIEHIGRRGFNIMPAQKWPGSVEGGIIFLKSFKKIIVHPRCEHTFWEFNHYQYKTDKQTNDILPDVVDANNHCIDAIRYALDGLIKMEPHAPIFNRAALNKIRSYGPRPRV